ncbi:MAG: hypothetical protein CM15mV96_060 [uncultured marine virus]|nr:MAG: hypothetical protein CM15mV96_060 [uncultured marine virus]
MKNSLHWFLGIYVYVAIFLLLLLFIAMLMSCYLNLKVQHFQELTLFHIT